MRRPRPGPPESLGAEPHRGPMRPLGPAIAFATRPLMSRSPASAPSGPDAYPAPSTGREFDRPDCSLGADARALTRAEWCDPDTAATLQVHAAHHHAATTTDANADSTSTSRRIHLNEVPGPRRPARGDPSGRSLAGRRTSAGCAETNQPVWLPRHWHVFLLHFDRPYQHARTTAWAGDLPGRSGSTEPGVELLLEVINQRLAGRLSVPGLGRRARASDKRQGPVSLLSGLGSHRASGGGSDGCRSFRIEAGLTARRDRGFSARSCTARCG